MGVVKRVGANGQVHYYIRYWVRGKEKWEAAGSSRRQAELALGKRRAQIREGKFFDVPPGLTWTYAQLLDRYLSYSHVAKKPRTAALDRQVATRLRPAFGALMLRELSPVKVHHFLEGLLRSGLSPSYVNYHLTVLKHSFTMAIRWELLREHPLAQVRLPAKIRNERVRYLTPEEFVRLYAACNPLWRRIILITVHTGLRRTELFTLRREQIDFPNAFLILTTKTTKNSHQRIVPLNAQALGALRDQIQWLRDQGIDSPWVFHNPATGKPLRPDVDTAWYTALRRAGITDFRFHDLRHTTASYLRMAGVDLQTIKEILGHQDIAMTQRYAHISQLYRLQAVRHLEGTLAPAAAKAVLDKP
jgi:integrase